MLPECHPKSVLQTLPPESTTTCLGGADNCEPASRTCIRGNEIGDAGHQGDLSAEDEIARAKAQVSQLHTCRKQKSSFEVGLGERRATSEVEMIWLPNLYTVTEHGQMIIPMHIQKCEF